MLYPPCKAVQTKLYLLKYSYWVSDLILEHIELLTPLWNITIRMESITLNALNGLLRFEK